MKICAECKYYIASSCSKFKYLTSILVTGLQEIKGRVSAKEQRELYGIVMYVNGACGKRGRFWCRLD